LGAAAREVLDEMNALANLIDAGVVKLQEMGMLSLTTEENARRILELTGGNTDAAANIILEGLEQ
jgi:hypothetical protein